MRPLRHFGDHGDRIAALYEPGERSTVVLIHGNSADHTVFSHQVASLGQRGFGVLAPDLPGHGLSDNASDPSAVYSFPGHATAIGRVIDDLGIAKVHVAGWSLGGHVGLELLGRDARVQSLMIWGTPPVAPSPAAFHAFIPSLDMMLATQRSLSAGECEAYARAMVGTAALPDTLISAVTRTDGLAREWMKINGVSGVGIDARDLVARDPRPLAVLHGEHEPFVRLDYLTGLAYQNLWRNEVQVIPGIGHAAHLEAPHLFNAMLVEFLEASS